MSSTKKTRDEIINYIIGIDYLYEKERKLKRSVNNFFLFLYCKLLLYKIFL